MRDNRVFNTLRSLGDQSLHRVKSYLQNRTPRQRLFIVIGMLLAFALVDVYYIVRSLSDRGGQQIEHIHPLNP